MSKGLDYDALFPGRFLKAGLFQGKDWTLTMKTIRIEELPQERGGDRGRGIIGFMETKLELVLNRTNGEALKAMFGRDTADWIGKRVTFFPAKIDSEIADIAIRIRGSPDIPKPITFELKLPRKKPRAITLTVTKKNGVAARAVQVPPKPPPPPEEEPPEPDEPPTDGADIPF